MAVIQMSGRELTRLRVLIDLSDDRLTVEAAGRLLGLGRRQVYITIDPDTLRLVMATPNMHLYELRLTEKPELQIDRREVVEARFMHPGGLREARRGGKVGEYVRRSAACPPSA